MNKEDFTAEWRDHKGRIKDVRITRGKALYRLPLVATPVDAANR